LAISQISRRAHFQFFASTFHSNLLDPNCLVAYKGNVEFSSHLPTRPPRTAKETPQATTRVPLVVAFPELVDQALAQRAIHVAKSSGDGVEGNVTLQDQEAVGLHTGESVESWQISTRGSYNVEDLAGNNIGSRLKWICLKASGDASQHQP